MECGICRARAKIEGGKLAFYYFDPEFGEEGQEGHARWLIAKKTRIRARWGRPEKDTGKIPGREMAQSRRVKVFDILLWM